MTPTREHLTICSVLFAASMVHAASAAGQAPTAPLPPTVTVTASATTSVANDRVQAWLRAEAESPNPRIAADQVNAAMAKALANAKAYPAVKVATSGYSTQQVPDKTKPTRWRVMQTVSLESNDFTATATLISKLQDEDGLLLSGMGFSLSDATRRDAEDALTQRAIKGWQSRAQQAAQGLGFGAWRAGHVTVQAGDGIRPYPVARASVSASGAAPVAIEGGTTDVAVTVSGEAVLDQARPSAR